MMNWISILLLLWLSSIVAGQPNVVCYWNSSSVHRRGTGKAEKQDIRPVLSLCTHLIIGFADIDAQTKEITKTLPKNPFKKCKEHCPKKFYLGVGGGINTIQEGEKYIKMLRSRAYRSAFIDSLLKIMKNSTKFDGVDLALPFSRRQVNRILGEQEAETTTKQSTRRKFHFLPNDKPDESGFYHEIFEIVEKLYIGLKDTGKDLTLTILPRMEYSKCGDFAKFEHLVQAIHVLVFDEVTPYVESRPNLFPTILSRRLELNYNHTIRYWSTRVTIKSKVHFCVSAFARTWKLVASPIANRKTEQIGPAGIGKPGPYARIPGLLSYPEYNCGKYYSASSTGLSLEKYDHPKLPVVVFGPSIPGDEKPDQIRIGYYYSKRMIQRIVRDVFHEKFAGIGIYDVSLDDFRGTCDGTKFPLVRSIRTALGYRPKVGKTS